MKSLLLPAAACLLLCQCETTGTSSDRKPSLADSGLSPAERVRAAKNKPLSSDPTDPLHKVRAADGAVGVSVLEF